MCLLSTTLKNSYGGPQQHKSIKILCTKLSVFWGKRAKKAKYETWEDSIKKLSVKNSTENMNYTSSKESKNESNINNNNKHWLKEFFVGT